MAANKTQSYGLDAELKAKQDAKYDVAMENHLRAWIQAVTGKPMQGDFHELLKSGVTLCELVNKIKAGTVANINQSKMAFPQRENISAFLTGCRSLGVRETDLFMTIDLFEQQNMSQVLQCLFALASVAPKIPTYHGPAYGVKLADANVRDFTQEQLDAAKNAPSRQAMGSYGYADTTIGPRVDKIVQLPAENGTATTAAVSAASYGVASAAVSAAGPRPSLLAGAAPRQPPPPSGPAPVAPSVPHYAPAAPSAPAAPVAGGSQKFCSECGNKLAIPNPKFCSQCGHKL